LLEIILDVPFKDRRILSKGLEGQHSQGRRKNEKENIGRRR
jgi:hypothetical protein